MNGQVLTVGAAPHVHAAQSTSKIMWHVVIALLPLSAWAVYAFGLAALAILVTTTLAAVACERLVNWRIGAETTIGDGSAAVTGLLLGLTLPPGLPLWMAAFGSIIAITVGKAFFGGLGFNTFNPALVGRAILQAAFPASMTTWVPSFAEDRFQTLFSATLTLPFMSPRVDAWSGATPLGAFKFEHITTGLSDVALGMTAGSVGETATGLILLGGCYLALRRMLNWRIPVSILLTVFGLSFAFHAFAPDRYPDGLFMICSGGLMLGAVFMATDMVTSPVTTRGMWLFGILIGAIVVVIRFWGGLPEGVMYAILLANASVPLIERVSQPRVFGRKP